MPQLSSKQRNEKLTYLTDCQSATLIAACLLLKKCLFAEAGLEKLQAYGKMRMC